MALAVAEEEVVAMEQEDTMVQDRQGLDLRRASIDKICRLKNKEIRSYYK